MIESREHLIHVLTEAAEIEHNLLCSYLYAAFSLKRRGEPGLTDPQGEAVERWRKAILKVALEEMAHLASVNNLLVAVSGAPHFDRPNLPVAPGYHPAGVVVRLTPFDQQTLEHFIYLERPEVSDIEDAGSFEAQRLEREARPGRLTPSSLDYDTIGQLYDTLAEGFRRLSGALGETVLIDLTGRGQVDEAVVKLPDVRPVTDLASALSAIEHIKEQGEGSSGLNSESHFDRFQAIKAEWVKLAADPKFAPAWPAAHDPVMRRPAAGLERVWVTEPDAAAVLDLGNAVYGAMLTLLAQAFGEEQRSEQVRLVGAGVEMMEASAACANALARMPAEAGRPGLNAGLMFAVPRNIGARPRASRVHFLERLALLRAGADRVLAGETRAKILHRLDRAQDLLNGAEPRA